MLRFISKRNFHQVLQGFRSHRRDQFLREIHRSSGIHEDIDQFNEFDTNSWQNYRVSAARQIGTDDIKRWPLHERIEAAGPGYINIARKTRNALRQIDRILDVFEPGQLALSFNGGKDSTVLLNLFIAACAQHPTHSFTHIQPIWFRHPEYEFPELVKYIEETALSEFTHHEGLKAVDGSKLSRLWTMHIRDPQVMISHQFQAHASAGWEGSAIMPQRSQSSRDLTIAPSLVAWPELPRFHHGAHGIHRHTLHHHGQVKAVPADPSSDSLALHAC